MLMLLSQSGEYERLQAEVEGGYRLKSDEVRTLSEVAEDNLYSRICCAYPTGLLPPGHHNINEQKMKKTIYLDYVNEMGFSWIALLFLRAVIWRLIDLIWDYYMEENEPRQFVLAMDLKTERRWQ